MKITVYKFNPATDAEPYYVSGEVPYTKDMSALHALKLFNENVAQVNYDYSCRGRLCGRCGTALTDRKGEKLHLMPYHAKTGCRMQVYGGQTFSALEEMPRIMKAGFAAVRVIGTRQELMRCKAAAENRSAKIDKRPTTFGHLYKGVE